MKSSRATAGLAKRQGVPPALENVVEALTKFTAATSTDAMMLWLRLDLTMPQFGALAAIWRLERVSGRGLAQELKVTPAAVVKVCDRLQARGYVERIRDAKDRRVWWFQLTRQGQRVFDSVAAQNRERIQPALQALSTSDRETLARIWNVLAETIQSGSARRVRRSAPR